MPEVVGKYIENDVYIAREMQLNLIRGYENDILKYSPANVSSRIMDIFSNVDVMLNNDNQKFKIAKIDANSYKMIEFPLNWLLKSYVVQRCNIIECINIPLRSNVKESNFKLYLSDVGLLMRKSDYVVTKKLVSNDKIYYGFIMENYYANIITVYSKDLFCYKRKTSEIDFLLQSNTHVIPVEIKSGNNTKAKSLRTYIESYNPSKAYKFSRKNVSNVGCLHNLLVYCFEFIDEFRS